MKTQFTYKTKFIFKYLFYIVLLSTFIFACEEEKKEVEKKGALGLSCYEDNTCNLGLLCSENICIEDKCFEIQCNEVWSQCNESTGACSELKEGFCLVDGHCKSNEFCSQITYKCEPKCTENELKCNNDGTEVQKCSNNIWIKETSCVNNQVCTSNFTCKDKCSSHNSCTGKEICNSLGQCVIPLCESDDDCSDITSINSSEKLYCDVIALPKNCVIYKEHVCGGESNNDMTSMAQEINITNLSNSNNIVLTETICIEDQEWYKINLTKDTSSLNFKLEFSEGDLDLIILDENFKTIGYSLDSQNTNTGGEELVNSSFLPKGIYYIHIYRYKSNLDIETNINSNYTLTLSNLDTTTKCSIANKDCENLKILRSVCDETTGSCQHMNVSGTANLGDLCEESSNCTNDASYGCFDFEIPGVNLDNYCAKTCSSDEDCADVNGKCQSFVVTSVCIKPCTEDNDCKLILDDETAVCDLGKCKTE